MQQRSLVCRKITVEQTHITTAENEKRKKTTIFYMCSVYCVVYSVQMYVYTWKQILANSIK